MPVISPQAPPAERLLATAMDLFYRQGYAATGINQIILEAEVAKASFYDHFKSKEDLLLAYATETSRKEIVDIRAAVESLPTARERFFAPFGTLVPWFEASEYRGCPFQNLMAEVRPGADLVHAVARKHREGLHSFFQELAQALKMEEPMAAGIDPGKVASTYLVLFEGAIATAVAYRQPWPVEHARRVLEASLLS